MAYSTRNETQYSPYDIVCIPTSFISWNNLCILLLVHVVWQKSGQLPPIHILYENERKRGKPCVSNISQTSQGEYRVVEDRYSITMTSKWAQWCLKSPASRLLTQPFYAQIKENTKAPHKWPVKRKMISFLMTSSCTNDIVSELTRAKSKRRIWRCSFQRVSVTSKTNQRHSVVI